MAVNPFLRGIIRREIDAKSFKGGMKERKALSDSAKVRGFNKREMNEILEKAGYDMKKRKNIMDQVLEKKLKGFAKKPEGLTKQQKERNIRSGRMESRLSSDSKTARVAGLGSFAGGEVATESRVMNKPEIGKTSGGFGLASSPSPDQGTINPLTTIGNLGSKKFL